MVFEGGFFGGAQNISGGNPYLNSTTVLFDIGKSGNNTRIAFLFI